MNLASTLALLLCLIGGATVSKAAIEMPKPPDCDKSGRREVYMIEKSGNICGEDDQHRIDLPILGPEHEVFADVTLKPCSHRSGHTIRIIDKEEYVKPHDEWLKPFVSPGANLVQLHAQSQRGSCGIPAAVTIQGKSIPTCREWDAKVRVVERVGWNLVSISFENATLIERGKPSEWCGNYNMAQNCESKPAVWKLYMEKQDTLLVHAVLESGFLDMTLFDEYLAEVKRILFTSGGGTRRRYEKTYTNKGDARWLYLKLDTNKKLKYYAISMQITHACDEDVGGTFFTGMSTCGQLQALANNTPALVAEYCNLKGSGAREACPETCGLCSA